MKPHGMGLLLDIVPNHMAASLKIPGGWMCSSTAKIPPTPPTSISTGNLRLEIPSCRERGRMVLPVLSDFYERLLAEQRIALRFERKRILHGGRRANRFP